MLIRRNLKHNKLALAIGAALAMSAANAGFSPQFELSDLNGSNGFVMNGASVGDNAGQSVSTAGDINGDGIDDLIIGAPEADPNGNFSGSTYVVFGDNKGLPNLLDLSGIDGSNGFLIQGESIFDSAGESVSAAGDVNGDGIDDLIIGAPGASPNPAETYSGASYVIFGSDQGIPNPLNLSGLDGNNGFVINGVNNDDESGTSVSAAGDVNGDGIDDVIIGAPYAGSGAGYVVFGSDQGLPSSLNLSDLNGSNGFRINGDGTGDSLGKSVSTAGDVNGDGIDDLILGAIFAGTVGAYAGASYVIFGSDQGLPNPLDLSGLDGSNGFLIKGVSNGDEMGHSVAVAGDINDDGFVDLLIGAPDADPNGDASGTSYVVFGSDQGFPNPLNLSDLDGSNGFALNGVAVGDQSGSTVSAAGDFNVDGIDDMIIGASMADPNGDESGASYVVYGKDQAWGGSLNLSGLNGANGFVANGVAAGDNSGTSVSAASDINGDGVADFVIGAPKADPNGDASGASYVVFGVGEVNDDKIFADGFE